MRKLLALLTRKKYWKLHSLIIKRVLKSYGVRVGRNFYIEGVPYLKLRGNGKNIRIGNNVSIFGDIDLRNRENGKIVICDNVALDNDCRFVAANDAPLKIGSGTGIGPYAIFNCGVDVTIGENCLIAGFCQIQTSDHGIKAGTLIKNQPYQHGKIEIGNDVWIGSTVAILKDVSVEDGCVIGAKSLLRSGRFKKNSIIIGIPGRTVKKRPKS